MAICGAIDKYGYSGFNLYILEILSEDSSKKDILERGTKIFGLKK